LFDVGVVVVVVGPAAGEGDLVGVGPADDGPVEELAAVVEVHRGDRDRCGAADPFEAGVDVGE
jgi:hypothetical protein